MNQASNPFSPRILVAPLDWGLGHATRCVPVIHSLRTAGCEVILAGEGKAETLLRAEFPQLPFLHLNGYHIRYGKTKAALIGRLFFQIPAILQSIRQERVWLDEAVRRQAIDAVISDNRYGLHHKNIFSVILTHQLRIKTPFGKTADDALQRLHYRYLNRFDECWVPDAENEAISLAGELSHPEAKPAVPVRYLGPLSRFAQKKIPDVSKHLLILLSGPEPQRTLLENMLLQQLNDYHEPVVLVRGLPGQANYPGVLPNVTVHNHLPAVALEPLMRQATCVIGRCGYSTVMDTAALQKKCILIPTPGQTEQEYLAKHLMQKSIALCVSQSKFKLKNVLKLATAFPYRFPVAENETTLRTVIQNFVQKITAMKRNKDEQRFIN